MTSLCVGALLVGIVAAFLLPVTILLLVMVVSAIIGSAISMAHGAEFLHVGLVSIICIVLVQIGYGIGLVGLSLNPLLRKLHSRNSLASALRAMISSKRTF